MTPGFSRELFLGAGISKALYERFGGKGGTVYDAGMQDWAGVGSILGDLFKESLGQRVVGTDAQGPHFLPSHICDAVHPHWTRAPRE